MAEFSAFELIQSSIISIKNDINSLADKYNASVKEIWIKLTELETQMKSDRMYNKTSTEVWYKSLSIVVSITAVLISIAGLLKEFISKIFK